MKKIFNILNKTKNDVDKLNEINVNEVEKKRVYNRVLKKVHKHKGKQKKIAVAASMGVVLTGILFLSNESVIAQIERLGMTIESFWGIEKEHTEYKKKIIKTVSDKGIDFTLNEVMLEDEQLNISLSVDYSKFDNSILDINDNKDPLIIPKDEMISVNVAGKQYDINGAGASFNYNDNKTIDMLFFVDIENTDLNSNFDIDLNIGTMEAQLGQENRPVINGNWDINFNTDGKALAKDLNVIDIDKKLIIANGNKTINLNIDELRVTPISMKLKYSFDENENFDYGFEDNQNIEFEVKDENGNNIDFISQGGSMQGMSHKWFVDRAVKKLVFTPIIYEYNKSFDKKNVVNEYTFEIDLQ